MAEAAMWGFVGASSLIVAAELTFAFTWRRMVIGLIMAFGVGALISSVAFELVLPAISVAAEWEVAVAMAAGSLVFFAGDRYIDSLGGSDRKNPSRDIPDDKASGGLGLLLGTALDGVPESAVLGMSLAGGSGVSVALLAGIWISNFPEGLGSTINMTRTGWSRAKIRLTWWGIIAMSAAAAGVGYLMVSGSDGRSGALANAFAAGALLTMIADEMAPEAYEKSQIYAGLATVVGFVFTLWLAGLG